MEAIESEAGDLLATIPNLLDDRTPDGASEAENVVVESWGEPRKGADLLWHDEILERLGGIGDAAKMSGARFSVLQGDIARLERALMNFFLDKHASSYTEVSAPLIVGRNALFGTGQLPKFEADLFRVSHEINNEDAFLIPTAEVPLTNLPDSLLDEAGLPLRLVSCTPCFRAEAGSYGRDTRGLVRQHQFWKVELVKVCTPETGVQEHADLTKDAEACLRDLGLPYRKVLLCSGDLGFTARLCYDLEVWLPGQQAYREISSCSLVGDFQARRIGLRYRPKSDGGKKKAKPVYPTTINGSGLAVGRTLVAILETYQRDDGAVDVPPALVPYMRGQTVLLPPINNK
ncbi:hypothetical protein CTAYLR_000701 [Chrysophaeum taylorii]|uniref:serine--tRNA ligase n=1 Tax=Chrysophaeum taylorii TaxID=2483200 RepID=A0AAD7U9E3_9STRA|nr:hypothetical protein CTAYLR_000701 [Chrysophaeum taylorii]